MRIAVFGDSLTAGYDGAKPTTILKVLIEDLLKNDYQIQADILLFGVPGDDTNGAIPRVAEVKKSHAVYNFVFFGANDAANSRPISTKQYARNLRYILNELHQPILITPPCVNEATINVDERNNANSQKYRVEVLKIAQDLSIPVIDLYEEMINLANLNQLFQKDGLHFSVLGYDLLALLISKMIKQLS